VGSEANGQFGAHFRFIMAAIGSYAIFEVVQMKS
jgi:hypothetical protein